jgi:hypothetical protein
LKSFLKILLLSQKNIYETKIPADWRGRQQFFLPNLQLRSTYRLYPGCPFISLKKMMKNFLQKVAVGTAGQTAVVLFIGTLIFAVWRDRLLIELKYSS